MKELTDCKYKDEDCIKQFSNNCWNCWAAQFPCLFSPKTWHDKGRRRADAKVHWEKKINNILKFSLSSNSCFWKRIIYREIFFCKAIKKELKMAAESQKNRPRQAGEKVSFLNILWSHIHIVLGQSRRL